MNIFFRHSTYKAFYALVTATLITIPVQAHAVLLDLSDIPLEVKEGVPPNIVLTMDDSGSMAWGFLPDGRTHALNDYYRSSTYNRIYYNPEVTYLPGVDENGNSLGNATFTAAWLNAYNPSQGVMNLATDYQVTLTDYRPTSNSFRYYGTPGPADYYLFDTSQTASDGTSCDENNWGHVTDENCYRRVIVSATSGVNRYSPEMTGCSPISTTNPACYSGTDERTNFANWFSYYRIRHLLAKTATTRAFAGLSTNIRVSWQALNRFRTIGDPLPFGGSHRTNFFNWIFAAPTGGGTPLTDAMWRAGVKFEDSDVYRKDPTDNTSPQYSCRQNFHFAFTDGYWNSNSVSVPGNYDGRDRTLPTTNTSPYGNINYTANPGAAASDTTPPIYRDGNSNYLADIAFYFWSRDLQPSLENNVPLFVGENDVDIDGDGDVDNYDLFWNPKNDPAEWQHMVNFTVGLGIDGSIAKTDTSYQELLNGTRHWGGNHVDDLWHAAINSRGRYFSARSPEELVSGFGEVIHSIVERKGSASSVATTSSRYEVGTNLFQAIYDPNDWSGEVLAKDVINNTTLWSAASELRQMIDNGTPRTIITFNGTTGIPFQWGDLSTTQQDALNRTSNGTPDGNGNMRLDWLRGDNSNEERNGGILRNRSNYLGDITHSDPVYIPPPGPPLFYYPDNLESVPYSDYVAGNSNRPNMLLFGANDGMVHILNADTGREMMAYVPSMLFDKLSDLTDPGYQHQYYIDRTIGVWDVFYGGSWHTVAIGGLGKGGQGIYALDISNPSAFNESNAGNIAMWEFTDEDDADLGYTYTTPYMMKMNNGKWMVAFSNGHNSTEADGSASASGNAILFLLDVESGSKGPNGIKIKLDTETGAAQDPLGQNRPNALSDIVAIDTNRDFVVDYIYAGDFFGNLWKFDVRDPDPANWSVFRDASNKPVPLFVARSPNGDPQPITFAPVITQHNKRKGFLVYIGTGSYIQTDDVTDNTVQTIYGIWDRMETDITTIGREHLLQQDLLGINTTQFADTNARASTDNRMRWYDAAGLPPASLNPPQYLGWRMDLLNDGVAEGERLFDNLDVSGNVLSFTTIIPSLDPCVSGGEAWAFRVNADSGSRFLNSSPWDYDNNGTINAQDRVNFGGQSFWGSGIQGKNKILFRGRPLLVPGTCKEANIQSLADGTIRVVTSACSTKQIGRRSWRQIEIQ